MHIKGWTELATAWRPSGTLGRVRRDALLLVVLGMLGGLVWYLSTPATFTAETRIAVGEQSLAASQVPGYVAATQSLASEYARYVPPAAAMRSHLGSGGDGLTAVEASPIPDSSIVRVLVHADSMPVAVNGADFAGRNLVQQVEATKPDLDHAKRAFMNSFAEFRAARAAADTADRRLAKVRAEPVESAPDVQAAREIADQRSAQAAAVDLQQQALGTVYREAYSQSFLSPAIKIIKPAVSLGGDSSSRLQRDILIGATAGAALAALLYYERRRRSATESSNEGRAEA